MSNQPSQSPESQPRGELPTRAESVERPKQKKRKGPPRLLLIGGGVAILIALVISIAQGGGSDGGGDSRPVSAQSAAPHSPSPVPSSAQADSGPCASHACIVQDAEHGLAGAEAKDNSVITKASCYVSTVKNDGSGDYTADCAATYSDGDVVNGYATVELSKKDVLFEPESFGG
jgi:hypothetical protein